MENIEFRLLTTVAQNSATEFVAKHIGNNGAPLLSNLQISEQEILMVSHQFIQSVLTDNQFCSYLAIDKNQNKVIACALFEICNRWLPTLDMKENTNNTMEFSSELLMIMDFNRLMWSGIHEFIPYPYIGPYVHCSLILVDPEYRRLGLFKRMMAIGLGKAYEEFKCRYCIGFFTSYKSQAYCEKEGWITLRWVKYEDYYVLGKLVFDFKHEPEQISAKIMMLDVFEWLKKRCN